MASCGNSYSVSFKQVYWHLQVLLMTVKRKGELGSCLFSKKTCIHGVSVFNFIEPVDPYFASGNKVLVESDATFLIVHRILCMCISAGFDSVLPQEYGYQVPVHGKRPCRYFDFWSTMYGSLNRCSSKSQ